MREQMHLEERPARQKESGGIGVEVTERVPRLCRERLEPTATLAIGEAGGAPAIQPNSWQAAVQLHGATGPMANGR